MLYSKDTSAPEDESREEWRLSSPSSMTPTDSSSTVEELDSPEGAPSKHYESSGNVWITNLPESLWPFQKWKPQILLPTKVLRFSWAEQPAWKIWSDSSSAKLNRWAWGGGAVWALNYSVQKDINIDGTVCVFRPWWWWLTASVTQSCYVTFWRRAGREMCLCICCWIISTWSCLLAPGKAINSTAKTSLWAFSYMILKNVFN